MEKLRAAVVGLNFGKWVIENELLGGNGTHFIELIGVCDLDIEKASALASDYGVTAYASLDAVLEDERIECVILITGPVGRAAMIDKIISAGKPVMTTKPFDISAEATLKVLKKADNLGIPVFMNSPSPLATAEIRQIEQWQGKYALGRPIGYRASTYCSYREKADGSWYDDPHSCPAAPIFRLGIYLLNDLSRFFPPVKEVHVMQSRIFTERPTSDNAQLSLLHQDGTIGSIFASFCIDDKQYYRCSYEINYERGTVYKNMGPVDVTNTDKIALQLVANVGDQIVIETAFTESTGAGYQWDSFYNAVKGKGIGPTIQPEQVASVITILEQMRKQSVEQSGLQ